MKYILFLILIIVLYCLMGFTRILSSHPQSVHQWAQCDRASVAYIFGTETLNFFKPQTNNLENGSGITGMEFPLLNYTVGIFYRIFGFHEIIFRLLMISIVLAGLMAAFQIANLFTNQWMLNSLLVLSFSFSPILCFYTPNFLPDAASLGFIMISWLFFLNLTNKYSHKNLILSVLFGLMATLIKISSLISIIIMISILILDSWNYFKSSDKNKLFQKNRLPAVMMFFGVIILVFCWYYYANWLSQINNSTVFLLKAKFTFSIEEIAAHIEFIKNLWWEQYYSAYFYYLILASAIFIIVFRKHAPKLLSSITILMWIGTFCFAFLMLEQFRDHDYYIITLLPLTFFHLLLFMKVFYGAFENKKRAGLIVLYSLFITLTYNGFIYCKDNFNFRYSEGSWLNSLVIYNKYFNLDEQLTKLGIPLNAKVISIVDESPNISLYLSKRRGITISGYEDEKSIENTLTVNRNSLSYIILNDSAYFEKHIPGLTDKPVIANINGLYIIKND